MSEATYILVLFHLACFAFGLCPEGSGSQCMQEKR
jgi:hypothetical protein